MSTLIGANGAGKSTTLRTIVGLVKAASGSIVYDGEELTGLPADQIVRRGITLVPEGRRVFPDLTVLEDLKIGAYTRKDDLSQDIEWVYSLFPRLKERHWQPAGTLSGGEQQMLAVGRALMSRPKLLMMDEPTLPGPCPAHRAGHLFRCAGRSTGRASPFCSSSKTPTWRCALPKWGMCWKRGASRCRAPGPSCSPTTP